MRYIAEQRPEPTGLRSQRFLYSVIERIGTFSLGEGAAVRPIRVELSAMLDAPGPPHVAPVGLHPPCLEEIVDQWIDMLPYIRTGEDATKSKCYSLRPHDLPHPTDTLARA